MVCNKGIEKINLDTTLKSKGLIKRSSIVRVYIDSLKQEFPGHCTLVQNDSPFTII